MLERRRAAYPMDLCKFPTSNNRSVHVCPIILGPRIGIGVGLRTATGLNITPRKSAQFVSNSRKDHITKRWHHHATSRTSAVRRNTPQYRHHPGVYKPTRPTTRTACHHCCRPTRKAASTLARAPQAHRQPPHVVVICMATHSTNLLHPRTRWGKLVAPSRKPTCQAPMTKRARPSDNVVLR